MEEDLDKFIMARALEFTNSEKVKEMLDSKLNPKEEEITEDIADEVDMQSSVEEDNNSELTENKEKEIVEEVETKKEI